MTKLWVVLVVLSVLGACGGVVAEAGQPNPCPCIPAGAREAGDEAACFSCLPDAGADAGVSAPGV